MTDRSLAALTGHDEEAAAQLRILSDVYRRHGLDSLRETTAYTLGVASPAALHTLLVEAVLTLSERAGSIGSARRDWDRFAAAEHADEQEQISQGGNP